MPADRRLKPNVWSMAGTGDNMKNLFKKGTRAAVILIMLVFWCLPVQASGQSGSAEPVPEGYTPIHNSDDLYGIRNDLTANYIPRDRDGTPLMDFPELLMEMDTGYRE